MQKRHRFRTARARARTIPLRRLVPNILTTLSLCSGLASLHFTLEADWDRALSAIAVAALFDLLDGGAARLLRASSRFGAVLDSLSDFVSFGVAPAVLLHQWMLRDAEGLGLAATTTFALCAALRLARYTSARRQAPGSPLASFFQGLPTPAAAGIVLVPPMIEISKIAHFRAPTWAVIVYTFFIAFLMISRLPCFSLKKLRIRRQFVIPMLVALGLVVVAAAKDVWLTAATVAFLFLCTIPLSVTVYRRKKARMLAAVTPNGAEAWTERGPPAPAL